MQPYTSHQPKFKQDPNWTFPDNLIRKSSEFEYFHVFSNAHVYLIQGKWFPDTFGHLRILPHMDTPDISNTVPIRSRYKSNAFIASNERVYRWQRTRLTLMTNVFITEGKRVYYLKRTHLVIYIQTCLALEWNTFSAGDECI